MKFCTITFEDGSSIIIEGLGPNTLIGAVADALNGFYDKPIVSIELSKENPA